MASLVSREHAYLLFLLDRVKITSVLKTSLDCKRDYDVHFTGRVRMYTIICIKFFVGIGYILIIIS